MVEKFISKNTAAKDDYIARARNESTSLKNYLTDMIKTMESNRLSATVIFSLTGRLAGMKKEAEALLGVEDIEDYAVSKFERGVTESGVDLLARIDLAIDAIKRMIPTDEKTGLMLVVKFDTDYSPAWTSFGPEQMEPVRVALQTIVDVIE